MALTKQQIADLTGQFETARQNYYGAKTAQDQDKYYSQLRPLELLASGYRQYNKRLADQSVKLPSDWATIESGILSQYNLGQEMEAVDALDRAIQEAQMSSTFGDNWRQQAQAQFEQSKANPAQPATPTAPLASQGTTGAPTSPTTAQQTQPQSNYTGASIVDYLKSTGQASDYASRAKLAQEKGIQNYTGTAEQNTQLLNQLRGGQGQVSQNNQTPLVGQSGASGGVSGAGTVDAQAQAQVQKEALLKEVQNSLDSSQLGATSVISGETAKSPELINWTQKLQDLQTQYGTDAMETEIADIDKQIADINVLYDTAKVDESNRLAPASIIAKRQNAVSEKQQIELNRLYAQKSAVVNQLNTKNGVISALMQTSQQTYSDALQSYQFEYNKALQAQQILSTQEDKIPDNARAIFSSTINLMQNSGITWGDLSSTMQNQLQQTEMQAGFAVGTMEAFMNQVPGVDVKWTNKTTDANGNEIMQFFGVDAQGNPVLIKGIATGGVDGGGGGLTAGQINTQAEQTENTRILNELSDYGTRTGGTQENSVSLGYFNQVKANQTLYNSTEFDKKFGYLLSKEEQKSLTDKTGGTARLNELLQKSNNGNDLNKLSPAELIELQNLL